MRARLVVAGLLLALCAAAPASASELKGGGEHTVAAEGGPLDLAGVSFGQRDRELQITFFGRDAITPQALAYADGGQLCAVVTQASLSPRSICLSEAKNRWQIRSAGKLVKGTVTRPHSNQLRISFEPAAANLRTGAAKFYVAANAAGCATVPTAAPAAATSTLLPCAHRLPRVSTYDARIWQVKVVGCSRHGSAQVSRGPSGNRIALTYDDGPSIYTSRFIDELARLGVPATFFMVGQQVAERASLAREILRNGSMIGDHSWNHANLGSGGSGASSQMRSTNAAIHKATGFTPCVFRPPYGSTGSDLVSRSAALGMTSILWTADPNDWRTPGTSSIVRSVLGQTYGGGIILSHDGGGPRLQTLAAMPQIVTSLKRRGYKFVTVTDLLGYSERLALVK